MCGAFIELASVGVREESRDGHTRDRRKGERNDQDEQNNVDDPGELLRARRHRLNGLHQVSSGTGA